MASFFVVKYVIQPPGSMRANVMTHDAAMGVLGASAYGVSAKDIDASSTAVVAQGALVVCKNASRTNTFAERSGWIGPDIL